MARAAKKGGASASPQPPIVSPLEQLGIMADEVRKLRKQLADAGYWGIVRWHDDDLRGALRQAGIRPSAKLLEQLHDSYYLRHIDDSMVEQGWENIRLAISELELGKPGRPKGGKK